MEIREAGALLAILSEAQDSCVDSRLPASAAMAGEETPGVGDRQRSCFARWCRSRTRTPCHKHRKYLACHL